MWRAPRSPGASAEAGRLFSPAAVALLVAALTLVRLAFATVVPITEDEAYYRLWALHPAFGHLDHPPMVGWWIAAGFAAAGDGLLGIRLPSIFAAALGSLALWRTAFLLAGRDAAVAGRTVVWFNATLLVGAGSLIATPDQPATLFWGLTLWALAEGAFGRRNGDGAAFACGWWLAVGLFAGLGLLSKYSTLFLGAGILLWLVADRRRWGAFREPRLWIGGALAMALFAPVVAWNAAHGWASFAKQFGRAAGEGLSFVYLPELLAGQIGLVGPLMVPFLAIGVVAAIGAMRSGGVHGLATGNPPASAAALLLLTSAPFLAYLLVHALHDRVQANWPAPLYPAIAILAATAAAGPAVAARPWLGALRGGVAPVGIGVGLVALSLAAMPLPGLARLDPLARFRGWDDLAADVDAARRQAGAAWIATAGYGPTAMLAYFLRDVPVVQLDERLRYVNAPPPDPALLSEPALFVVDARARKTDALLARFAEHTELGSVERWAAGAPVATFRLFGLAAPRGEPLGDGDPAPPGS